MTIDRNSLSDSAKRALEGGTSIVGAVAGAAISMMTGDPLLGLAGVAGGELLAWGLNDVTMRVLSEREQKRVGAVSIFAVQAFERIQQTGGSLRTDGFFESNLSGRSPGDEIVEHVLIAAKNSFEENKLPYFGNLIAAVACATTVDRSTANWAIDIFDRLSWTQVLILSAFARTDEFKLPDADLYSNPKEWSAWSVHKLLHEMSTDNLALLNAPMETGERGQPRWPTEISAKKLTTAGSLIFQLSGLDQIPAADIEPVVHELSKPK